MKLHRSIDTPLRDNPSWEDAWNREDKGLIACWERGRRLAEENPHLAMNARQGQLVVLNWKGGVERALKKKQKFGSLQYLAQWQGLRGQDLDVDMVCELTLTCSGTGMVVTFTPDPAKYAEP